MKVAIVAAIIAATAWSADARAPRARVAFATPTPVTAQPLLQPTPQPQWRMAPMRRLLTPTAQVQKSQIA